MKYVTLVKTADGQLHGTVNNAKQHANKQYRDALTKLAYEMIAKTKGKDVLTVDFINDNLNRFANLVPLRDDMILEPPSTEEEE